MCASELKFQLFVLGNSNTKVIEISLTLVIVNQKIFAMFKKTIKNLCTCNEKVRICLSVQVSVIV